MSLRLKKVVSINDFIDMNLFANMQNLTERQLAYRLMLKQVHPHPVMFGNKYVFEPDAKIIIPAPIRTGGRPEGSTIANGARSPGPWIAQNRDKNGRKLRKLKGKNK